MQDTLNELSGDCSIVKMVPNPVKCEALIICPPKKPIVFPQLKLNDSDIPLVHKCKLLGVHINSSLNWIDHVDFMIAKVNKCIFILYRARQFNFTKQTMFTLYSAYESFRP